MNENLRTDYQENIMISKPLFTCDDPYNLTMLEAIKKVIDGKWTLAPFQRPKSWKWSEQKLLLDSLLRGIPRSRDEVIRRIE